MSFTFIFIWTSAYTAAQHPTLTYSWIIRYPPTSRAVPPILFLSSLYLLRPQVVSLMSPPAPPFRPQAVCLSIIAPSLPCPKAICLKSPASPWPTLPFLWAIYLRSPAPSLCISESCVHSVHLGLSSFATLPLC